MNKTEQMRRKIKLISLKQARQDSIDEYVTHGDDFYCRKQWLFKTLALIDAKIRELEPNWTTLFTKQL